ncbi:lipid storage droplets surface-binding protein 1-like isoform X1 [Athalia rosae]|uniref:lipid storage droplets surface-binding protein 1-like isoform X1 n=2 Tax=Athalia rosae TaxID=37344 RepID=UPI0020341CF8|nr:lipid storage droplets surface-binding protein 1-like isoform X1 [Athalia rosae]XP_048511399.1 lipid storage droplets surface-binding protein 1-like isoform X1 [Athalia rosae]XP_048511400.1 lipid storage droplets surface-binding protein 1-like isoform X1 [Athalia rosae]
MTGNAEKPETSSNVIQKSTAFSIVYIAYGEVSTMRGVKGQPAPYGRDSSGEADVDKSGKEYECIGRIAKIPSFESRSMMMSNLYSSVKQSHEIAQTMFDNVAEGFSKSAEVMSPVTAKIGETLEGPLRAIDNVVCTGLDFLEENIPSVKLPPEQMYECSKDYVNSYILEPVVRCTLAHLENFRDMILQYSNSGAKTNAENKTDD